MAGSSLGLLGPQQPHQVLPGSSPRRAREVDQQRQMLAPHQLRRRRPTVHAQPYRAESLARDHGAKMQPGTETEKCEAEAIPGVAPNTADGAPGWHAGRVLLRR